MRSARAARFGRVAVVLAGLLMAVAGAVPVVVLGASGDSGGGGGRPPFDPLALVPYVVVGLAGITALAGIAYLVLRRQAGPPLASESNEWWTCASCGATNIDGSPRCYACGTLPGG
jgi:hypothetical protein